MNFVSKGTELGLLIDQPITFILQVITSLRQSGVYAGRDALLRQPCPLIIFGRHLHYWVRVPSAYQTDLPGDKQPPKKKQKKQNTHKKIKSAEKKGPAADSAPWIRHWGGGGYPSTG